MTSNWFRKTNAMVSVPLVLILLFFVACGSSAEPVPTAAPEAAAPADTEPMEEAMEPAAPTAAPRAAPPADPAIAPAGAKNAPSFASYWQPDTAFYGQPVYGGTLRINYEDPLEHANIWGARTGAALRFRSPSHDQLITDNPYDSAAPFIPDLALGWTIDDDLKGITFFLREGVKWHNGADFTCEDARFSFHTMATGEGLTVTKFGALFSSFDEGYPKCLDDFTLEFRFQNPTATPILPMSDRNAACLRAGRE